MSAALALLVRRTRAMLFDFVIGFGFKRFANAATDAAIILGFECKKPRVCEAKFLIFLEYFLVAGTGFEPVTFRL
jgi:hypothetical protein